jgi:hypothetical protein
VVGEFFFLPGGFSIAQAAVAPRLAAPCCQTAAASGDSPPAAANNSGHVSPAFHPSSPAVAANWSAANQEMTDKKVSEICGAVMLPNVRGFCERYVKRRV